MKFQPITISRDGEVIEEFYPTDIISVKITINKVLVEVWDDFAADAGTKITILRKDYNYQAWSYFLLQLKRTFIL